MKILLVEPDPFQTKVIRKTLGTDRFSIRETASGEDALAILQSHPVNLILQDMDLPGMSGLELCRQIHQTPRFNNIPVIFLTARTQPDDVTAALREGASDYIIKGSSPQEILARIDAQLSHVRMVDRLLEFKKQLGLAYLVTGLCHEILNPLTILSGNLELLSSTMTSGPTVELLENSHDLCFQMSRTISHLKQYTEGTQAPFESVELKDVIEHLIEIIELVKLHSGKNIEFVTTLAEVPPVMAQRERLGQAILNILYNALAAIENTGQIQLSVGRDRQRGYIRIEDSGEGIETENLDRIFNPFFTTRDAESSVGLGLAVAQKIVREHGGEITVHSCRGEGSRFTIYVPLPRNTRPIPILGYPTDSF